MKKILLLNIVPVFLFVNAEAAVILTPDTAICQGNCVQLSFSGGTTYSWFPSTGLSSTTGCCPIACPTSTVTYTVGNGLDTTTITVMVIPFPLPVADAGPDIDICLGQYVQLSASGGVTCSWAPETTCNAGYFCSIICTPTSTTTYSVTVTDANGCTNSDNMTVFVHPTPFIDAGNDTCINIGGVAQLCATGVGISYSWIPSTALSCTTCVCPDASPTSFTSYVVKEIDPYGCINADTVVVGILPFCQVGVKEITDNHKISIYPNPVTVSSILLLSTQLKNAEVIIYDMLGHEMMRKKMNGDKMEIERGNLVSGVYFVKIVGEGKEFVQKLIVE